MPLIVVGSLSEEKLTAVRMARLRFPQLVSCEVVGTAAPSGVREQPEIVRLDGTPNGRRMDFETCAGAITRMAEGEKAKPEGAIFVGIESGVYDIGFIVDMAVIVVKEEGRLFYGTSAGLAFPRADYDAAMAEGFDTTTIGKALAARIPGTKHTDPHAALTGISRAETMIPGVCLAFGQMLLARQGALR